MTEIEKWLQKKENQQSIGQGRRCLKKRKTSGIRYYRVRLNLLGEHHRRNFVIIFSNDLKQSITVSGAQVPSTSCTFSHGVEFIIDRIRWKLV